VPVSGKKLTFLWTYTSVVSSKHPFFVFPVISFNLMFPTFWFREVIKLAYVSF